MLSGRPLRKRENNYKRRGSRTHTQRERERERKYIIKLLIAHSKQMCVVCRIMEWSTVFSRKNTENLFFCVELNFNEGHGLEIKLNENVPFPYPSVN